MSADLSMILLRNMFQMHLDLLNNGKYKELRKELEAGLKAAKRVSPPIDGDSE